MASRSEDENNTLNSLDNNEEWLPDEVITAIQVAHQFDPELSDDSLAEQILIKSAPAAAYSIAHLSKHSPDPRIRMSASAYIIDQVIGKASVGTGIAGGRGGTKSASEELINDLYAMIDSEVAAQAAQATSDVNNKTKANKQK